MDVARRAALSNFYREEFLRHIEYLQAAGILDESNREVADRPAARSAPASTSCAASSTSPSSPRPCSRASTPSAA